MLVTTAMVGVSLRKLPSLSSASATKRSPSPRRALVPSALTLPPTTTVGSSPAARRTVATIEVVVVLPCEPAIVIAYRTRISSASISARGIIGTSRARARDNLGVLRVDGARVDDDVGAADVVGRVADEDAHAETLQAARVLVGLEVRAADVEVERTQDLGEAAHADAADADEVHVADATAEHQCTSWVLRCPCAAPFVAARGRSAMPRRSSKSAATSCAAAGLAARARRVGHRDARGVVSQEALRPRARDGRRRRPPGGCRRHLPRARAPRRCGPGGRRPRAGTERGPRRGPPT